MRDHLGDEVPLYAAKLDLPAEGVGELLRDQRLQPSAGTVLRHEQVTTCLGEQADDNQQGQHCRHSPVGCWGHDTMRPSLE